MSGGDVVGPAGVSGGGRQDSSGRLWGVGVGPGDPELVTLKTARLIRDADVVAYHQGVGKRSNARRIVDGLVPADVVEEVLQYPVTTGTAELHRKSMMQRLILPQNFSAVVTEIPRRSVEWQRTSRIHCT